MFRSYDDYVDDWRVDHPLEAPLLSRTQFNRQRLQAQRAWERGARREMTARDVMRLRHRYDIDEGERRARRITERAATTERNIRIAREAAIREAQNARVQRLRKNPAIVGDMPEDTIDDCTICLDKIRGGNTIAFLPCNHLFHIDCIKAWKKGNEIGSCPNCRQEFIFDYEIKK